MTEEDGFAVVTCCVRGTKYLTGVPKWESAKDRIGATHAGWMWRLDGSEYWPSFCPWCSAELPKEVTDAQAL